MKILHFWFQILVERHWYECLRLWWSNSLAFVLSWRQEVLTEKYQIDTLYYYKQNKIESQSKTASRLFENKIKTMSRPWLTSHVKTMFDKTMLSRLCQDYLKTMLVKAMLDKTTCLSRPYLTRPCLSRPYLLRPFWQDLVFRYQVMTNLIHSELI